ncbi:MAG: Hpt domain-containing protein [Pseudomonadales bacterium]|nr:Hpt domain-containing protein [Pseudomonadales bacterium]
MDADNIEEFSQHFDKVELENEFLGMEAALNQNTADKKDIVQNIFRTIHSLKGTAAILEIPALIEFLHMYEEVLGIISKNGEQIQGIKRPEAFDFFLQGLDLLERLVTALRDNNDLILKDQKELFNFYIRMMLEARTIMENQEDYFHFVALDEDLF